jgi:iron complex outermembrane receptor protein
MKRFERKLRARPVMAALGLFVVAGLGVPSAASAQDAAPANDQVAQADTAQASEEVTVTARRRKESIQSTPLSVTAIAPKTLENQAAPDIQDLEGLTPNLVIDPVNAGPSAAAIAIRGISFEDIEKSFDPAVGVIIDGIYLGTNTGQLLDFFDFQAIEVLRGPQGTLFGRNTTAGVINITRSQPTGEFGGKLSVTIGDYGRQEYRAVLNLPAFGDLSTKLFYLRKESDGYQYNVTRQTNEPGFQNQNYGVVFRYEPGEIFNAQLTLEHSRQRSETASGSLSQNTDLICLQAPIGPGGSLIRLTGIPDEECNRNNRDDLYTTFGNIQSPVEYDETAVTLEANVKLGEMTLTSVTGYRDSDESVRQDFDSSSINFYDTLRVQNYDQFSQEFRLAGDITDDIDFVAGVYYFKSEYDIDQRTNLGPILGGITTKQVVAHESRSMAAFIDIDWTFAENWRLSFGGRYTKDEKEIANTLPTVVGLNLPLTTARGDDSWSEFTPKVSLDWQATDDILIYAAYSRGFRSGGFNGRATTPTSASTPYDPEFVDAYELGAKTSWLDRRLTLNMAIFQTDYSDKQEDLVIPIPTAPFNETLVGNAAAATIRGFELDLNARVTDALTISGSLGLLDAEYDSYPRGVVVNGVITPADFSNLNLRRTPDVTASLGFDYRFLLDNGDVVLSASYQYISEYDTTITPARGTGVFVNGVFVPPVNDPRARTQALKSLDASLTWNLDLSESNTVKLSVFGRNLTDERGLGAALPISGLWAFGGARAPRTWGVEIGYQF